MILKIVARFIHVLLWLKVVISPVLIGLVISVSICIIHDEINFYVIASFTVIGLIVNGRMSRSVTLSCNSSADCRNGRCMSLGY